MQKAGAAVPALELLFQSAATAGSGQAGKSVHITLPRNASPTMQNVARVFAGQVENRSPAKVVKAANAEVKVELAIEPGAGAEGFKIVDGKRGAVRIAGNDERGVLYGVGKFLRTSRYESDGFVPGTWRGTSVPEKPVRGIYFATHFYNFYHAAPIQEVQRYLEEVALWGYNSLMVWFDMHHYNGFDDPEAIAFRGRLRQIMQAAHDLGLGVGLVVLGNEAYNSSPTRLRAVLPKDRGGNYACTICPNQPGAMEYLRTIFTELFDWAHDLKPENLGIWPYDQGGCICDQCRPWGSNGFLKCARATSALAHEKLPGAKIILSTSYFDKIEWHGLQEVLAAKPDWLDMVMAEPPLSIYGDVSWMGWWHSQLVQMLNPPPHPAPLSGGYPVVGFPEISMWGMNPWGAYGATPRPMIIQQLWRAAAAKICEGGFPYSEGIWEDMNKVLYSQLYWKSDRDAVDILDEYIRYEFSPSAVTDVRQAVLLLEQVNDRPDPDLPVRAVKADDLLAKAESELSPRARESWRWRILRLRATIERHGRTRENETLKKEFDELRALYHVQPNTHFILTPPLVK
jgi:hypothetical protein